MSSSPISPPANSSDAGHPVQADGVGSRFRIPRDLLPAVAFALTAIAAIACWTVVRAHDQVQADGAPDIALLAATIAIVAAAAGLALSIRDLRGGVRMRALIAGAHRLSERDFTASIPVTGHDEFAQLARAFNTMAQRLGRNFETLNALAEIDRIILTEPDITRVAAAALRCSHRISGCSVIALALLEPGTDGGVRIFRSRPQRSARIERVRLPLADELRARLLQEHGDAWTATPPLPPEFLARERRTLGERARYLCFAMARGELGWGSLVLGSREPLDLTEDQRALLRGVADRLAVAFSSVERDRRLHEMAHSDPLTGLPNRPAMLQLLARDIVVAQQHEHRVAVMFIDLDRFKQANDTLGHAVGDALLRNAAQRVRNAVRAADAVARIGGDEFTVVIGEIVNPDEVRPVARNLIKALSQPFEVDGETIYVGASIGIAMYPEDGREASELLKNADTAMYRAKEAGRNRAEFFRAQMNVDVQRRSALDRDLRVALKEGQFVLHYQPQFDLRDGTLCSVEALIRWEHPQQGLLYPGAFISVAEEIGLIDTMGNWALREACLQFMRWRDAGVPIPRIAVNVSNHQLRRESFVPYLKYLVTAARMPPRALEIEVTESMFLEGGQGAVDALREIVGAGVEVSIDDFGTGYSSFGYLKTLPASVLKLDRSFVADTPGDADAASIVAAIVNMAHTLRKEVVAEGIETPQQLAFLQELGCGKGQGFLFSRALPPNDIAAFAANWVPATITGSARSGSALRRPMEIPA